jgi:hypothetical protein
MPNDAVQNATNETKKNRKGGDRKSLYRKSFEIFTF